MAAAKVSPYTMEDFSGGRKTYQLICLNEKL